MKKSSSSREGLSSMPMSVPPEIITLNQAGFQRTQRMLALCDRRLSILENDSKAADALPIRDMQALIRMIHTLEKDLQAFAAILYPTGLEGPSTDEKNLESVLAQTVQVIEKMDALSGRSAPDVSNGKAPNTEKFSQSFFNQRGNRLNPSPATPNTDATGNGFNTKPAS